MTTRPADDVVYDLADTLREAVPAGWTALRLTVLSAGSTSTVTLVADGPTGPVLVSDFPPEVLALAGELREATAEPARGAWFICRLELDADGTMSVTFDYDTRPPIDPPPVPETYAEDLRRFPRAPELIPAWLRGSTVTPGG